MKVQTYIACLYKDNEEVDSTSIDENNLELAEDLFYGEFGHIRDEGDCIILIKDVIEEVD